MLRCHTAPHSMLRRSFLPQHTAICCTRSFTPDVLHCVAQREIPQSIWFKRTFRPTLSGSQSMSHGLHGPEQCLLTVMCCRLSLILTGVRTKVHALINSAVPQLPTTLSLAKWSRHPPNARRKSVVVMGLSEVTTASAPKREGTRSKSSCFNRVFGSNYRDSEMRFQGN